MKANFWRVRADKIRAIFVMGQGQTDKENEWVKPNKASWTDKNLKI